MLTREAESRQAAHHRALRAQEQQQQDQAEKAEKTAKKRAADRERMQKRRNVVSFSRYGVEQS